MTNPEKVGLFVMLLGLWLAPIIVALVGSVGYGVGGLYLVAGFVVMFFGKGKG